ncbi:flagella synthesis protein FlgN [Chitinimonas sp.]|uniref:flagella synthesis protein FlgN n=1 Tax=Chitinimonas sp. TaxID=1934313 RepID=UPI0035B2F2EA
MHALELSLKRELEEIDAFVALLEREQQALIDNTLAELLDLSKQKAVLAGQLEAISHARRQAFEQHAVVLANDAPHELISVNGLPAQGEMVALWQQLLNSARRASALNQTNGRLIDTRQQQNQQLMGLLQANASHNAVLSYDAFGQARLSKSGGSLGKA